MPDTNGTAANDSGTGRTSDAASSHGRLDAAREKVVDAAEAARTAVSDGYSAVRERAADAYADARERVGGAYASVSERATAARTRATEELEGNPFAAVVGGLAIGALVAAVLPRTERETKALGAIGGRINDAARGAASAAADAARERLDEAGLNRDRAQETVRKLIEEAAAVASTAASAAGQSIRGK